MKRKGLNPRHNKKLLNELIPDTNVIVSGKEVNELLKTFNDVIDDKISKNLHVPHPKMVWGGRRAGKNNPSAREFTFISPPPDCIAYTVVGGARAFCDEYNISFSTLYTAYPNKRVPPPPALDSKGRGGLRYIKNLTDIKIQRRINTTGWMLIL